MAKEHTDIPRGDNAFLAWIRNFIAVLAANAAAWNVPQSEVTNLQTLFTDYETKLTDAQGGNRGKADAAEKNAARKALEAEARDLIKRDTAWNHAVSDAQREPLGITVHDAVRIDFRDQGSGSRRRPYGYNGAVFSYTTTDAAVADYELPGKSALLTHSPWTLTLPRGSEGKMLSGVMAWQNEKGEKEPWSEIQSIIIP